MDEAYHHVGNGMLDIVYGWTIADRGECMNQSIITKYTSNMWCESIQSRLLSINQSKIGLVSVCRFIKIKIN